MLWREWFTKLTAVVAVMVFVMTRAFAQTSVSVAPAAKNVLPGTSFSLTFNVANVPPMHGYHVIMDYDNTILHYDGTTPGTFINSFLFFPTAIVPHTVDVAHALLGAGTSVSGSGTLFTMQFTATGAGVSAITLTTVELRTPDNSGNISPVTINSGSVSVGNPEIVYVNSAYSSGNAGGHDFGYDAFNAVANGVSAVSAGGTVNIAAAPYNESVSITKDLTLTGSGNPMIQDLTLNTPALTLGGNIKVNNTLTLTSGHILLGSSNFTLGTSCSVSGASSGSFVVTNGTGKLVRLGVGTTSVAFPIGSSATSYNPITLKTGSGTDDFSARVIGSVFPSTANDETAVKRTWDLSEEAAGGNGVITFSVQWNTGHEGSLFNHVSVISFRNTGGTWMPGGVLTGPITGSDPWVATVDAPSGLGSWTIGNETGGLPIQLVSFTGSVVGNGNVALTWVTLSEVNNYGFYVQRKRLGEPEYFEIPDSFVAGHGTTNEPQTYTFTDISPGQGTWLYRLRQVDLNGAMHFTEHILVDVLTEVSTEIQPLTFALNQNYPNPFNPSTIIKYSIPVQGHVALKIYTSLGQEVATLIDEDVCPGTYQVEWNAEGLAGGVYFCRIQAGDLAAVMKLLLLR